ncbi:MAG: hypothetical protein [Podoviridae sp. cty5g4]|nr:MAG: hypothetical protein [Podoviridae sp. cty5g4]
MDKYQVVTKSEVIYPKGEYLTSELATIVEIEDEGAGVFVIVSQTNDNAKPGEIRIDEEEWITLRQAIENAIHRCTELNKKDLQKIQIIIDKNNS